jgi:hypothetical protein
VNRSETITALAAALAAFGAEVTNPPQNRTANVPTKAGGTYSYSYADLGDVLTHVRPVLAKHGLAVTQEVVTHPDSVDVTTMLLHKSGEYMEFAALTLPAGGTAQNYGSAITYGRRYGLMAALDIAGEADDDAAHANPHAPAKKPSVTAVQGKPATEKQIGKIHAIAKEAGVTDEQLHKGILRDYNLEHLNQLSTKQASEMIDKLGALPAVEAPPKPPLKAVAEHDPDDDIGFDDEPVPGMDAEQARKSWERPAKEPEGLL